VNGDPGNFSFLLSLLLVFVVMYFMILRPQARRQKERDRMIKAVQKGDRILTNGGFFATVVAVKADDVLVVRLGDTVKVDMSRSAVSQVLGSEATE
jgi:preprotein translocase subunit YajC